jgi:hypothetical protein
MEETTSDQATATDSTPTDRVAEPEHPVPNQPATPPVGCACPICAG